MPFDEGGSRGSWARAASAPPPRPWQHPMVRLAAGAGRLLGRTGARLPPRRLAAAGSEGRKVPKPNFETRDAKFNIDGRLKNLHVTHPPNSMAMSMIVVLLATVRLCRAMVGTLLDVPHARIHSCFSLPLATPAGFPAAPVATSS